MFYTTKHPLPDDQQLACMDLTDLFDASLDISASNPEVFNVVTRDIGVGELLATWIVPGEHKLALETKLAELGHTGLFWAEVDPNVDYVAETAKNFPPLEVGPFYITRNNEPVPAGKLELKIAPNRAFGSGEHATTTGCLMALQSLQVPGRDFKNGLDLGAGSGVLAIAAAKLMGTPFLCTDNDGPSVPINAENAELNGVSHLLTCLEADGVDHPTIQAKAPFDLVFANILLQPLLNLSAGIVDVLAPHGFLILSGFTDDQAAQLNQTYTALGMRGVAQFNIHGWQARIYLKG